MIWTIPIIAIAIGAWLAWDTLSKEGPRIVISFEDAEGLQAGQSQLKFKDIVLGTVKSLEFTKNRRGVLVSVATTAQAEQFLTTGTQFWVVKPRLFAGNISGFSTLLSGSYIGLLPGDAAAKAERNFVGREEPPLLDSDVPGTHVPAQIGSAWVGEPRVAGVLSRPVGWPGAGLGQAILSRQRPELDWFPWLARHLHDAERGPARGCGPLRQVVSRRVAGRVLLVGDAAGYEDALTGEGISLAVKQAAAAIDAIVNDAPESYERAWHRVTRDYRLLTRGLVLASTPPAARRAIVPACAALPPLFRWGVKFWRPDRMSSCDAADHRAFQIGSRFSANASGPSRASSDRISVFISRTVRSQPTSSAVMTPSSTP